MGRKEFEDLLNNPGDYNKNIEIPASQKLIDEFHEMIRGQMSDKKYNRKGKLKKNLK